MRLAYLYLSDGGLEEVESRLRRIRGRTRSNEGCVEERDERWWIIWQFNKDFWKETRKMVVEGINLRVIAIQ